MQRPVLLLSLANCACVCAWYSVKSVCGLWMLQSFERSRPTADASQQALASFHVNHRRQNYYLARKNSSRSFYEHSRDNQPVCASVLCLGCATFLCAELIRSWRSRCRARDKSSPVVLFIVALAHCTGSLGSRHTDELLMHVSLPFPDSNLNVYCHFSAPQLLTKCMHTGKHAIGPEYPILFFCFLQQQQFKKYIYHIVG